MWSGLVSAWHSEAFSMPEAKRKALGMEQHLTIDVARHDNNVLYFTSSYPSWKYSISTISFVSITVPATGGKNRRRSGGLKFCLTLPAAEKKHLIVSSCINIFSSQPQFVPDQEKDKNSNRHVQRLQNSSPLRRRNHRLFSSKLRRREVHLSIHSSISFPQVPNHPLP